MRFVLSLLLPADRSEDWQQIEGGRWLHRPWIKVAVNRALRAVQSASDKWVIFTETVPPVAEGMPPRVVGYGFGRVRHSPA